MCNGPSIRPGNTTLITGIAEEVRSGGGAPPHFAAAFLIFVLAFSLLEKQRRMIGRQEN
jgi:hypothetical protein